MIARQHLRKFLLNAICTGEECLAPSLCSSRRLSKAHERSCFNYSPLGKGGRRTDDDGLPDEGFLQGNQQDTFGQKPDSDEEMIILIDMGTHDEVY